MKFVFDKKGHLKPYKRIEVTFAEFEQEFVSSFEENSTRPKILGGYKEFLKNFQKQVSVSFTHWINGSFVTTKRNPQDIDFVTLINYETYVEKEELIDNEFRLKKAREKYGVDAYTCKIFPSDHARFIQTKTDLAYWNDWFSFTKMNQARKRLAKGYLEIHFDENTKF